MAAKYLLRGAPGAFWFGLGPLVVIIGINGNCAFWRLVEIIL